MIWNEKESNKLGVGIWERGVWEGEKGLGFEEDGVVGKAGGVNFDRIKIAGDAIVGG